MAKHARRPKPASALTLMEIMVALGIVATISLLVLGVLARLLSAGGKTAHQTAAGMLAEEVISSAVAAGPPRWGFPSNSPSDWHGERKLILPGQDSSTSFDYKVEVLSLRKSPQDLGTMAQVSATVSWFGDQPGAHRGDGETSVRATRTVYVRGEVAIP